MDDGSPNGQSKVYSCVAETKISGGYSAAIAASSNYGQITACVWNSDKTYGAYLGSSSTMTISDNHSYTNSTFNGRGNPTSSVSTFWRSSNYWTDSNAYWDIVDDSTGHNGSSIWGYRVKGINEQFPFLYWAYDYLYNK